jgi:hypothetical protein
MEMQEVRVGERGLFAWDGRVLEVFGASKASGGRRFHPAVTELRIQEPDNKGRAVITLNWHDATTTIVQVGVEEFARLRPLLDGFAAAVHAASQG